MITFDERKIRDKELAAARELGAELNLLEDFGRFYSVSIASGAARCVVAGRSGDVARVLGAELNASAGLAAGASHTVMVVGRRELAAVLTRRARVRSAFAARHWEPPAVDVALVVLCTPIGCVLVEARRQLAAAGTGP